MKYMFVVIESWFMDWEAQGSHPIGVYSSRKIAEEAIENAKLSKIQKIDTFEEFLSNYTGDPNKAELMYDNYVFDVKDINEYSWSISDFVLDKKEIE